MTAERLHNMLKMLADATGGGSGPGSTSATGGVGGAAGDVFNYDMTLTQLRGHLASLMDREVIEYIDGSYQLVPPVEAR
jgi:hypothetical protein